MYMRHSPFYKYSVGGSSSHLRYCYSQHKAFIAALTDQTTIRELMPVLTAARILGLIEYNSCMCDVLFKRQQEGNPHPFSQSLDSYTN